MSNLDGEELNLRLAGLDDAAALARFAERAFRDTFEAVNTREDIERYVARAFAPATMHEILRDPGVEIMLCEAADEFAGYVELWSTPAPDCIDPQNALEIRRLYVGAIWHGRGVAQKLLAAARDTAQRRGVRTLWLGVWEHNPRAVAFYRKTGFSAVGSQPFQLGNDLQMDVVMSCAVSRLIV